MHVCMIENLYLCVQVWEREGEMNYSKSVLGSLTYKITYAKKESSTHWTWLGQSKNSMPEPNNPRILHYMILKLDWKYSTTIFIERWISLQQDPVYNEWGGDFFHKKGRNKQKISTLNLELSLDAEWKWAKQDNHFQTNKNVRQHKTTNMGSRFLLFNQ